MNTFHFIFDLYFQGKFRIVFRGKTKIGFQGNFNPLLVLALFLVINLVSLVCSHCLSNMSDKQKKNPFDEKSSPKTKPVQDPKKRLFPVRQIAALNTGSTR
jgi:hypothetical protein